MLKPSILGLAALFVACESGTSAPAPSSPMVNSGDIFLEMPPARSEVVPALIGGEEVDRTLWPVTVYSSQGSSRCSANVIGPQTLIIAAHCVGNGRTATFKLLDNKQYTGTCTHAPGYDRDPTADWALCKLSAEVTGYPYEMVNVDASKPAVGDKVLLMGYGCTQAGGGGGNDGKLRAGEASVISMPSSSTNDIVTKGGAALCFGDSGGPAWIYLDAQKTKRAQISVNSRGDIRTTSYLSALAVGGFKAFVTDWSTKNAQKVCGVHADAPNCRGSSQPDPQDPLPEHCRTDLNKFTACLFGTPRTAPTDPEGCRDAYANLFACEEAAERTED